MHCRPHRGQRGIILLMLLIALTLIIIAMALAAPKLAEEIKRDREVEMIHRGTQYARAVKRYYRKFGRYPTSIEQLENTNNLRFLRKRYNDPMSKDGKWRLVRFGEVQFGQQGSRPGSIGAASSGALPPVVGGTLNQAGSGFGTQPENPQYPSSSFSQAPMSGPPISQPGSGMGQTFGGGAILGVASTSEAKGFHEYNGKAKYKQWLFIYDLNQDRGGLINGPYNPKAFVGSAPQVGTSAGQMNQQQPGTTFSPNNFSAPTAPSNQDTSIHP